MCTHTAFNSIQYKKKSFIEGVKNPSLMEIFKGDDYDIHWGLVIIWFCGCINVQIYQLSHTNKCIVFQRAHHTVS